MESPQETTKKEGGEPPTDLKLGDIIGHGAFGIIFSADSLNFDQLGYMKNFAIEGANAPGGMQMTQICMELCGKTVAEWIASTPQKGDLSTKLLQVGICVGTRNGLKFLHDEGIVHRDLKPLNIMFSLDEEEFMLPVKIGDFGLARFLHTEESLTSSVGTLAYMAPEVLTKKYDQQSDLYSLGCVMWEVVSLLSARERQDKWHELSAAKEGATTVERHMYFKDIEEDIVNLTVPDKSARTKLIKDLKFVPSVLYVLVSSTYELVLAFQVANDDAVIQLAKGTYKGNFLIKQNRLRLVGAGEDPILTGDGIILHILGTGCVLLYFAIVGDGKGTGILITSNNSCLAHLNVISQETGIKVYGNNSYLTSLDICNVECGIWFNGHDHLVKNCCIRQAKRGVRGYCKKGGKRTVISGLRYSCCEFALHLDGEYFIIDNLYALNSQAFPAKESLTSVQISGCHGMLNKVDICEEGNINFLSESADCILLDSKCGRLTVNGKRHFCNDVNVHGTIELLGSNMEIRNCKFQFMTASKNSNFGSFTPGEERNMSVHQLYSSAHWKDVQYLLEILKRNHPSTVRQRLQEVAQVFKESFQKAVKSVLSKYTNALEERVNEYGPSNYPDDIVKREVQIRYINFRRSSFDFGHEDSIGVKLSSGWMLRCLPCLSLLQTKVKVVRAAHPNVPILLSMYEGDHRKWDLSTTETDAERHDANVHSLGEILILGIPRMENPAEVTITMQLGTCGIVTVSATYGVGDERQDLDVMEIAGPTGLEIFRPVC